ncbi:hypothetical protein [Bradyrhizobium sp. WU425]|uniref:hypothetical protein n=1 Tax=Bradyrhizobium sp. WU425 TaxID=187029 RepID=UPI001E3E9FF1|nr:hypothetical protein [Bradyrhizobium canariense]UFW69176.1 hypothetical protein BcanWU425_20630 [Bradyrhizobium canariense]
MNFQVSILKLLASYPTGLATLTDIKRDLAFLATSGADWASYSKRLGATLPSLDVFSLGFVQRYSFGWRLTAKGAAALELMEQKVKTPVADIEAEAATSETLLEKCPPPIGSAENPDQPSSSPVDRRALFTVIDGGRSQAA